MGLELKIAREKAGYTIDEVANKLNIRKQYLINIEEERYDDMPGQVYINGYKKMYYEFLGLTMPAKNTSEPSDPKDLNSLDKKENKFQKYVILASIVLFVCIVLLYSFIKQDPDDAKYNVINNEFLDD